MSTTPAQILDLIYSDLVEWAALINGEVTVARNPWHVIDLLSHGPATWRCIMHWEGDDNPADNVRAGSVVENNLSIIIDGDLGMSINPDIELIRDSSSRTAFLGLLAALRARMLAYRFPWLSVPNNRLRYEGTDNRVEVPTGNLAAYNMRFALYSVMDQLDDIELSL